MELSTHTIKTARYCCPKHGDQGSVIGVSISINAGDGEPLPPSFAGRERRNYCWCCWVDAMDASMEQLIEG